TSLILGACAFLAISCQKKDGKEVAQENLDFHNQSLIQVYNATLGSSRNMVYVDANFITGAALSYASVFPSTPSFASIVSGYRAFLIRDTLSTTTQPQMSFAENFQAGE